MQTHYTEPSQSIFRLLASIVLAGIILYVGRPLFIPLSFALFISFILQPLCNQMEQKGLNRAGAILIGILSITLIFGAFLYMTYRQFLKFVHEWPAIREKIGGLIDTVKLFFIQEMGFSVEQVETWSSVLLTKSANSSFEFLETTLESMLVNLVMLVLIPVYAFLILYYRHLLVEVLYSFFASKQRKQIADVIGLSIKTYYNFIKGMALVYLIVGILNSIGLLLLGVPHAFLFGFLTAIMTFIPYIGIIVAALLPISYAWITYNSVWYPLGVIGIFTFVQYLEANVLFPWAVGQKLELNTLITLVVIIIGGILWGAAGMILFIPFAAIIKLIADRMEGWESLAKLMGK